MSAASKADWAEVVVYRHASGFALCIIALLCACGGGSFRMSSRGQPQSLPDGGSAWVYALQGEEQPEHARGVVLYVGGSNGSVLDAMGAMAGLVMMDMQVFLLERRGLNPEGESDSEALWLSADREQRIADALAQANAVLTNASDGVPVILMGTSEGADIAAEMAAREPRIGYLLLLGGGGGMSQADELRLLLQQDEAAFGIGGPAALEDVFDAIRADPQGQREWLGHPYRRWSSYLWSPPTPTLMSLEIPIFMVHGAQDRAVPMESARALVERFRQAGKDNLTYVELAGADHSFCDSTGRSLLPIVEVEVLSWLNALGLLDERAHEQYRTAVHRAHPELLE